MKKIRMGVIGLGGISNVHIEGILSSPDAELVALCDIDKSVLKQKAEKYGITESHCFLKHMDLLECPDVDAVSICTPNSSHFDIAADVIRHKKPLALEKPITLNLEEASKLKEMAEEAGVHNMICFSYRFKAAARYARWLIANGHLGKIHHVYAQYLQSWGKSESLPLIWRFVEDISGSGAHGDLGSHMLDLTRFLVGDFVKVCAQAGTFITKRKKLDSEEYGTVDVDDYCNYMAELEGGIPATFNITRYAYGRGNYQRIEIYGSKGGLVYTLDEKGDGVDTIELCLGEPYEQAKDYHQLPVPNHFKANQMQSFFDIIQGKGDGLAATLEDGYINQELLDSIIESFKEEKWVYLKVDK
jgi:predicted dehydrogenase